MVRRTSTLITLLCPSRARPDAAYELGWSFKTTAVLSDTWLTFCLDTDDPTLADYLFYGNDHISTARRPGTGDPTGPLNHWALASDADIIGFIGDDSRLETKGWDRMVTDALKGRGGFAWGFDGTDNDYRPTTLFVTRNVIQSLGWFALPTLKRGFFDIVWFDLAMGTKSFNPVQAMFRHDNSAGDPKSPNFKPEAFVDPAIIEADRLTYVAWKSGQSVHDIRNLGIALDRDFFFP